MEKSNQHLLNLQGNAKDLSVWMKLGNNLCLKRCGILVEFPWENHTKFLYKQAIDTIKCSSSLVIMLGRGNVYALTPLCCSFKMWFGCLSIVYLTFYAKGALCVRTWTTICVFMNF